MGQIEPESEDFSPKESAVLASQFVALYSANSRRIYTYILTLIPSRTDAGEVFQEVSMTLWEQFQKFEQGTNFGAWACRVAYYKVLQSLDKRKKTPAAFSDVMFREETLEAIDFEVTTLGGSLDSEYEVLAKCLAKLNQSDSELIKLRYQEAGAPRQLAERLGLPVKAVYRSLERIRRVLLECVTSNLATGRNRESS